MRLFRLELYRNSSTIVFLWTLQIFWESNFFTEDTNKAVSAYKKGFKLLSISGTRKIHKDVRRETAPECFWTIIQRKDGWWSMLEKFYGRCTLTVKKKRSHLPKLKARIFWQVKGKMDFQKCRVTLNINQKYSWWPNSNSYFKKYILQNIKLKHAFLKLLFLWPRWLNHLSSCIFYFIASYLIRYEKGNTYCKEGK